jgi:hypothetical protein
MGISMRTLHLVKIYYQFKRMARSTRHTDVIAFSRTGCHNQNMKRLFFALLSPAALIASSAIADPPVIEKAVASVSANGWRFDVTLSHPDTGWEHYADGWRVLDMAGNELGLRVLVHPHVNEQPFTRSLGNVQIPSGTMQVQIQARCLVDGWAADPMTVTLP